MLDELFGSATAAKVILYLAYVGEGHIRGIAANFDLSHSQVDRTMKRLEGAGIIVAKEAGRTRLFQISPSFIVKKELIALADKAVANMPAPEREKYIRRLRPRKTGKKL